MEVVRLTNLGNLTLRNLLRLEERYRENAGLKRKKLENLWGSRYCMDSFERIFSYYLAKDKRVLIHNDDGYGVVDALYQKIRPANKKVKSLIRRYSQMGLVKIDSTQNRSNDLVNMIERDDENNPVQDLRGVTIELTGLCNLRCKHCYRGGSRKGEYGMPVEDIKLALEPLLRAGIGHLTFTGGEPTLRRKDLLELLDYASQFLELREVSVKERLRFEYGEPNPTIKDVLATERYVRLRKELTDQLSKPRSELCAGDYLICNENTPEDVEKMLRKLAKSALEYAQEPSDFNLDSIGVLSNAFFKYQRDLVRRLKSYGNVSMQTSLDSYTERITDRNRGRKGVFAKVMRLIKISRKEKFDLSITGHNLGGAASKKSRQNSKYINRIVSILEFSGMLQLGNAVRGNFKTRDINSSHNYIGGLTPLDEDGWCWGFTDPEHLHIRPTGNVGNCLYAYALPQEFGNLYTSSMIEIVNGIQNSQVYQMFKDGSIEKYQHELDKSLFRKKFSSSCEPMILTLTYGMIKERLIEQGVENPVKKANQEVARMYKFLK